MRTSLAAILLALACASCLSSPGGLQRSDARPGSNDAPIDAAFDAAPPPSFAWPPAAVDLKIVAGAVADLDHDGLDDLVLASASPSAPALYVLRGQAHGFGASYAATIPMSEPAVAVDVADLNGDGSLEIAALSVPATGRQRVSLFLATGTFSWQPALHKEFDVDTTHGDFVWNVPLASVRITPLTGARAAIAVEAKGTATRLAELPSVDAIGFAAAALNPVTEQPSSPTPEHVSYPIEAFFLPRPGADADLLIATYFDLFTVSKIGDGDTAIAPAPFFNNDTRFAMCDFDRDGQLDVIGGGTNASVVTQGIGHNIYLSGAQQPTGLTVGVRCGAFDDQEGADIAFLQAPGIDPTMDASDQYAAGTSLSLVANFGASGSGAQLFFQSSESPISTTLSAADAAHVLVDGDFDHDGTRDLVVVSDGGVVHCYDRSGVTLAPCAASKP